MLENFLSFLLMNESIQNVAKHRPKCMGLPVIERTKRKSCRKADITDFKKKHRQHRKNKVFVTNFTKCTSLKIRAQLRVNYITVEQEPNWQTRLYNNRSECEKRQKQF